jgi:hypothetical protein
MKDQRRCALLCVIDLGESSISPEAIKLTMKALAEKRDR